MARSMPCTGNGVNTSHLRKPALRTFSAACSTDAAVRNSAIMPNGLLVASAISELLLGRLALQSHRPWFVRSKIQDPRSREAPRSNLQCRRKRGRIAASALSNQKLLADSPLGWNLELGASLD